MRQERGRHVPRGYWPGMQLRGRAVNTCQFNWSRIGGTELGIHMGELVCWRDGGSEAGIKGWGRGGGKRKGFPKWLAETAGAACAQA